MKPEYIIGVDESGTGAFAGPFTVTALMSAVEDERWLRELGAADSKVLRHSRRLALCNDLAPFVEVLDTVIVPHDYTDQRLAWEHAVIEAVLHCMAAVDHDPERVKLYIDGREDHRLTNVLWTQHGLQPEYVVHADATIPQVSAASIFAKSARTAQMARLHEEFPMYGWAKSHGKGNDGYGTPDHWSAIRQYGVCRLHRRIRPLIPYFDGKGLVAQEEVRVGSRSL